MSCLFPGLKSFNYLIDDIGRSSGGARGTGSPFFWLKKEEMTEGRKASRASK